jgi:transposase
MSDISFDPTLQDSYNGPLAQPFANKIKAFKNASGASYDDVAKAAGLSASFVGNLVRRYVHNGKITAIRTQHVGRLVQALKTLEAQHGIAHADVPAAIATASGLTMAAARQALAGTYGVSPQCIEIVIRG